MSDMRESVNEEVGESVKVVLLSSAFEDPNFFRSLSPDVQLKLLEWKLIQIDGIKYGTESLFIPRGVAVALAIVTTGNVKAVAYGYARANSDEVTEIMRADLNAIDDALLKAFKLLENLTKREPHLTVKSSDISKEERVPIKEGSETSKLEDEVQFSHDMSRGIPREPTSQEVRQRPQKISSYQRKFFSLVAKLNWSLDKAKAFLKKHTGKESTMKVEPEEWNKVLTLLEQQLKAQGETQEISDDEWEEIFR